jgi:hypothetical protein
MTFCWEQTTKKKLGSWHSAQDRPQEETEFMTFCWEQTTKKELGSWHSARDRPQDETAFMAFCSGQATRRNWVYGTVNALETRLPRWPASRRFAQLPWWRWLQHACHVTGSTVLITWRPPPDVQTDARCFWHHHAEQKNLSYAVASVPFLEGVKGHEGKILWCDRATWSLIIRTSWPHWNVSWFYSVTYVKKGLIPESKPLPLPSTCLLTDRPLITLAANIVDSELLLK